MDIKEINKGNKESNIELKGKEKEIKERGLNAEKIELEMKNIDSALMDVKFPNMKIISKIQSKKKEINNLQNLILKRIIEIKELKGKIYDN